MSAEIEKINGIPEGALEDHDNCALPLVRRVYALLGYGDADLRNGHPLPRGWHFVLFTPTVPQPLIGPDGTQVGNESAEAPADLPRRMMGGRRFTFFQDIPIGANVRRVSKVIASTLKNGRSGKFLVRTTRHLVYVDGGSDPALQEDSDSLFRAPSAAGSKSLTPTASGAADRTADWQEKVVTDETMLFRYSACTFNAHRIHYDAPYATKVEGYSSLVVNAGLTVLLLREFGSRLMGNGQISSMSTRNTRPIFCGAPLLLRAKAAQGGVDLWAEDAAHQVCAEVTMRQ